MIALLHHLTPFLTGMAAVAHRPSTLNPDAELLARCEEFHSCQATMAEMAAEEDALGLPYSDPRSEAMEAARTAVYDRRSDAEEAITNLTARTDEGLVAKARIALWELDHGAPEAAERGVAWSLARDLLGRTGA